MKLSIEGLRIRQNAHEGCVTPLPFAQHHKPRLSVKRTSKERYKAENICGGSLAAERPKVV